MKDGLSEIEFTLAGIRKAYAKGVRPADIVEETLRRIEAADDPGIFLHLVDRDGLIAEAEALGPFDPQKPLWGIPYAIKDNIDLAGAPTTAACPAFAYTAEADATAVARLRAAGALAVGKTNLDQFATGLVGVRTPYPVPRNAIDPAMVPGGSSSGSAVAVALGIVPFALGTDTAGSGRVPAGLNNIVGLKPTLGAISSTGLVPACRTLDTISVFAQTVDEAYAVFRITAGYDAADPYSRPFEFSTPGKVPPKLKVGIPNPTSLHFDGDEHQAASFKSSLAALADGGAKIVEIDFAPFYDVAKMLYDGAWVAEREIAMADLLAADPEAIHPVTRQIVDPGLGLKAADTFRGIYRLAKLKRTLMPVLASVDLMCVPTMPRFVTRSEIEADPIGPNALLGTYTNFVNLLDMCGLAVPTAPRADGRPGSVTLLAEADRDGLLASIGRTLERLGKRTLGATRWPVPMAAKVEAAATCSEVEIAVCGAHMSGLPLNVELTNRGGRFLRATKTAPVYRLFALAGGPPVRPGMVRTGEGDGYAIEVEVWTLPRTEVGGFLAGIPSPLGLGTVRLADGTSSIGFVCEAIATVDAQDVTAFGGWRAFLGRGAA